MLRVPLKHQFEARLDDVIYAYKQKMAQREFSNPNEKIQVRRVNNNTYNVRRTMPRWFSTFGGQKETSYDETMMVGDRRAVTSCTQELPFGGRVQVKLTFAADGDSRTRVFGDVKVDRIPKSLVPIVNKFMPTYVKNTFSEERQVEEHILSSMR